MNVLKSAALWFLLCNFISLFSFSDLAWSHIMWLYYISFYHLLVNPSLVSNHLPRLLSFGSDPPLPTKTGHANLIYPYSVTVKDTEHLSSFSGWQSLYSVFFSVFFLSDHIYSQYSFAVQHGLSPVTIAASCLDSKVLVIPTLLPEDTSSGTICTIGPSTLKLIAGWNLNFSNCFWCPKLFKSPL